jgi:hypothetical protein
MARRTAPDRLNNFSEATPDTRFIGVQVPTSFHRKLRFAADEKGISLAAFLRESLAREIFYPRHRQEG